jgi:hypothetical protein
MADQPHHARSCCIADHDLNGIIDLTRQHRAACASMQAWVEVRRIASG